MADYTPVQFPARVITSTLTVACSGGDLLAVSGSGTVAPAWAGVQGAFVGVAAVDGQPGDRVTFFARGFVHESISDGVVTAGDMMTPSLTPGRGVATAAAGTLGQYIIGWALTSAPDNSMVRWMEA